MHEQRPHAFSLHTEAAPPPESPEGGPGEGEPGEGDAGEGTVGFSLDVDAASGETVVQVADDQAVKHTADFFLRHIAKMDSITQDLKKAGSGMSIATS